MKQTFWSIVKGQFAMLPPVAKADLAGKTVIVLGANTGLGFEAVKHFASMNPGRLIMACRSESRGQAALESVFGVSFNAF
jgi:retinol dehydrogenase-12